MIGNKIANRSTKNSKNLQQYENYKEIPKGRYISSEERQKVIDDLRLI